MDLQSVFRNKKYLFLDRDGVINKRNPHGYITKWEDFIFLEGVLESLKAFSSFFQRIIIITNQQGIGKGLMTEMELKNIHEKLKDTVTNHGGRIDAIYHCPVLKQKSNNCRKPGIKMAQKAQEEFPEIDFAKSIMVGDTESDMLFAQNAGMSSVLLEHEYATEADKKFATYFISSLNDLSNLLK